MIAERKINLSGKVFPIVVILLLFVVTANAQLVQLNLSFVKDTINIGEQTTLRLEIINQKHVALQAFPLKDSLNKEIEIIDSLASSKPDSNTLSLHVTSFKSGQYVLPRIPLVFKYENTTDTIYSPELLLTVLSPPIDNQAEIKDIKPNLTLPFRLKEIFSEAGNVFWIIPVLLIIAYFIYRFLRKKKEIKLSEPALPPHIIALQDLDKLKEEKLWQKGEIKEFYSRLSDIMRIYLENRYQIPAMEYVSSETMQSFNKILQQEDMLSEMLEGILLTSDIVKFAKGDPLPAENQGNLDNAYLFIGQTKIEEIAPIDSKAEELKTENVDPINIKE